MLAADNIDRGHAPNLNSPDPHELVSVFDQFVLFFLYLATFFLYKTHDKAFH